MKNWNTNMEAILRLVDNPALWGFLGVFVTAYLSYRGIMRKNPQLGVKKKIRNATNFEELKAVVEVLQNELESKDRRHRSELKQYDDKYDRIEAELRDLYLERSEMIRLIRKHGLNWPPEDIENSGMI